MSTYLVKHKKIKFIKQKRWKSKKVHNIIASSLWSLNINKTNKDSSALPNILFFNRFQSLCTGMHIEDTTIHNLKEEATNAAKATIVMESTYTFHRKNMIRNKYIPIHPSQRRKLPSDDRNTKPVLRILISNQKWGKNTRNSLKLKQYINECSQDFEIWQF